MRFVFDLDGTICFKGKPIPKEIVQSLIEARAAGNEIIFASARPIRDMLPVINDIFHHTTLIGGNGSLIAKDGKLIKSESFSLNEFEEIKRLINKYNATFLIDGEWDYAYTGPVDHFILQNLDPGQLAKHVNLDTLFPIVKVLILTSDDMGKLLEELLNLNVYVNNHRNENILDISPCGINKWSALQSLGVKRNTYIAFGNDSNDLLMFENARYSIQVGDHEQLAPFANEKILLEGNYVNEIAHKILELSKKYSSLDE